MRDPEYVAALFENILEHVGFNMRDLLRISEMAGIPKTYFSDYKLLRQRIIDLMVEIELGNTPDWDQINGILPTLEG